MTPFIVTGVALLCQMAAWGLGFVRKPVRWKSAVVEAVAMLPPLATTVFLMLVVFVWADNRRRPEAEREAYDSWDLWMDVSTGAMAVNFLGTFFACFRLMCARDFREVAFWLPAVASYGATTCVAALSMAG